MTLDEAIKHCEEKAEELREEAKELCEINGKLTGHNINSKFDCLECAEEHEQLAEWLKDYKRLLKEQSNDTN